MKSSSVVLSAVWRIATPALLTRMSGTPKAARAAATAASHCSATQWSIATAAALPPAVRIAAATTSAPSPSRSAQHTAAPSAAKRSAIARPFPLAAPVTIATRPARRPGRGAVWSGIRPNPASGFARCAGSSSAPSADEDALDGEVDESGAHVLGGEPPARLVPGVDPVHRTDHSEDRDLGVDFSEGALGDACLDHLPESPLDAFAAPLEVCEARLPHLVQVPHENGEGGLVHERLRVAPEHRAELLGAAAGGRCGRGVAHLDGPLGGRHGVIAQVLQDLLLGGEVVIDAGFGEEELGRDLLDRRAVVAAAPEDLGGGAEDAFPAVDALEARVAAPEPAREARRRPLDLARAELAALLGAPQRGHHRPQRRGGGGGSGASLRRLPGGHPRGHRKRDSISPPGGLEGRPGIRRPRL